MNPLETEIASIESFQPIQARGTVSVLRGLTLIVNDLPLPVGSLVRVRCNAINECRPGEVVGFEEGHALVMLLGSVSGVRPGDDVESVETTPCVRVSHRMLGRVINGLGEPIDGQGPITQTRTVPITPQAVSPLKRRRISRALPTGVRVIDGLVTVGAGQRMGVFAGPGVGKSTMLGSIARHTEADISVIALIGERGREVRDFLEESLGEEGLARSVVVVATSDESPLMRIRAFSTACAVAEMFRADSRDVMLMVDSVTRFAQAQRQIGLAVGEPPATKGYTPSVFAQLPVVLERAGAIEGGGSITGFYTVLVDGDDMTEPIADAVRGILDGHVILSRDLARRGHFPAIDVLDSISRLADTVSTDTHLAARRRVLRLLASHKEVEDLIQIGAYASGSNPDADIAIQMRDALDTFVQQSPSQRSPYEDSVNALTALAIQIGQLESRAKHQRAPQPSSA
ncbi:MAG: FliI/YscN family ATPase [Phycisphaerales bacterium JB043]